jgi:hypothetical protein
MPVVTIPLQTWAYQLGPRAIRVISAMSVSFDREDALLRSVGAFGTSAEEVDDGLLLAYRNGQLDPTEEEQVDALLARSPEARALMVELSRAPDQSLKEALTPQPRRLSVPAVAGFLALAAAVFLFVALPGEQTAVGYQIEAEGFVTEVRGQPEASSVLNPDSHLAVTLRPETSPKNVPEVAAFVVRPDGVLEPADAFKLSSRAGVYRLEAKAAALFQTPGAYEVVFVLGASQSELDAVRGLTVAQAKPLEQWVGWWELDVEYRTPSP